MSDGIYQNSLSLNLIGMLTQQQNAETEPKDEGVYDMAEENHVPKAPTSDNQAEAIPPRVSRLGEEGDGCIVAEQKNGETQLASSGVDTSDVNQSLTDDTKEPGVGVADTSINEAEVSARPAMRPMALLPDVGQIENQSQPLGEDTQDEKKQLEKRMKFMFIASILLLLISICLFVVAVALIGSRQPEKRSEDFEQLKQDMASLRDQNDHLTYDVAQMKTLLEEQKFKGNDTDEKTSGAGENNG